MGAARASRPRALGGARWTAGAWQVPLVACIAGGVGLWRLGRESFWLDEGISAVQTKVPWSEFARFSWESEPNQALYHFVLRMWSYIVPETEAGLRLLSVVGFVTSAVVTYLLVERLLDRTAGLIAASLVVANVFALRFAQETRPYAWLMATIVVSWYLLVRWWEEPDRRWLRRWIAVGVVSVALHPYALFVIPAQALSVAYRKAPMRGFVRAALLLGALLTPFLLLFVASGTERFGFIPPPSVDHVNDTLIALSGHRRWLALTYLGIAVGGGVVAALSNRRSELRTMSMAFAWLAVPIVLALAVSVLVLPIFYDRYLVVSLPAIPVLVAAGLSAFPRPLAAMGGAIIVVLAMLQLRDPAPVRENWRGAMRYVVDRLDRGDVVTAPPFAGAPARYYLYRYDAIHDVTVVSPAAFEGASSDGGPAFGRNVWSVTWLPHLEVSQASRDGIVGALTDSHRRGRRASFTGVEVLRFRPRQARP